MEEWEVHNISEDLYYELTTNSEAFDSWVSDLCKSSVIYGDAVYFGLFNTSPSSVLE